MDGILGVGPLELIIIVVLALVILGPERLPATIRQIVRFIRQTRAIGNELTAQFSEELNLLDDFNPKKILEDVAGLDDDEEFDAKSILGIDEDDLKLDVNDTQKASSRKRSKTATKGQAAQTTSSKDTAKNGETSATASASKRTKPALGEVDPEETTAVDAIIEETESQTSVDVSSGVADDEQVDNTTDKSVASDPDEKSVDQLENRVEVDAVDSISENRIAPPSMTAAQSLVAGKARKPEVLTDITDKTVTQSSNITSAEDEPLPEGVDAHTSKAQEDVGEV